MDQNQNQNPQYFDLPITSLLYTQTLPSQGAVREAPIEQKFRNGETVILAGRPLLGLITVVSGQLKRYRNYQGAPFLAGLWAPGEVAGFEEAITALRRGEAAIHRETLEAVGDTVLQIEPFERAQATLKALPPSVLALLVGSLGRSDLRHENHLKRPLELLPVRARVAATLWFLAERHGRYEGRHDGTEGQRVIDLDLTREEVAHLAGTVYESVIRTLTSLKKEGVIDLRGRVIRIQNEDQLARIGQIATGESYDQNTVPENHNSSNNGHPKEAC